MNNKYYVSYQFGAFIAYEILVNGIVVESDLREGRPGPTCINPYILKSGKQKIKIKIAHIYKDKGAVIKPTDIEFFNKGLSILNIKELQDSIDTNLIKNINFPKINMELPYVECEWEFEADVPYVLKGWEDSQDLSELDQEKLESLVVNKFQELRDLLNKGKGEDFVKQLHFVNEEYFTANYYSNLEKEEYISNLIEQFSRHKNIMPKINNYNLKILPNAKAVTLESLDPYGQGILTAENTEEKESYLHYTILHLPKGSERLQVLRMNSYLSTIEGE